MKTALILDTETDGMVLWDKPYFDPKQPNIVQLAGVLMDIETGTELSVFSSIVRPQGFTIPPEMTAIHGISQELALRVGVDLVQVMQFFTGLMRCANVIVAHNVPFDLKVIKAAYSRLNWRNILPDNLPTFCTMHKTKDILKMEGKRGFKFPKLSECIQYFFNEELKNAHNALVDVRACARIFRCLQKDTRDEGLS